MDIDPPHQMKLIMHFQVYRRFDLHVARRLWCPVEYVVLLKRYFEGGNLEMRKCSL